MRHEVQCPLECATVWFAGRVLALFWTNVLPASYNISQLSMKSCSGIVCIAAICPGLVRRPTRVGTRSLNSWSRKPAIRLPLPTTIYSSTMQMAAVNTAKKLVNFYQTMWDHNLFYNYKWLKWERYRTKSTGLFHQPFIMKFPGTTETEKGNWLRISIQCIHDIWQNDQNNSCCFTASQSTLLQ